MNTNGTFGEKREKSRKYLKNQGYDGKFIEDEDEDEKKGGDNEAISFATYVNNLYASCDDSDITIVIVPFDSSSSSSSMDIVGYDEELKAERRGLKKYHLHKIILGQSTFLRTLLFTPHFKEKGEREIVVAIHDEDFITIEVLDLLFHIFYANEGPNLTALDEQIEKFLFPLHAACRQLGFGRGEIYIEKKIEDSITDTNVTEIISYCEKTNMYHSKMYRICMQYLKIFLVLERKLLDAIDIYTFGKLITSEDLICFGGGNKSSLLRTYRSSHENEMTSDLEWGRVCEDLQRKINPHPAWDIISGEENVNSQGEPFHKSMFFFTRKADWKETGKGKLPTPLKDLDSFYLCDYHWTFSIFHNNVNDEVCLTLRARSPEKKDTTTSSSSSSSSSSSLTCRSPMVDIFSVQVKVMAIHRTHTKTTIHASDAVRPDHLRLDLKKSIDAEELDTYAFPCLAASSSSSSYSETEGDKPSEIITAFVTHLTIKKRRGTRWTRVRSY